MADEQEQELDQGQVIFNGFHQGSVMEGGVLGPIRSYIALRNTRSGRVLNVEIGDDELKKVIMLSRIGEGGDLPVETNEGAIAHPALDVEPGEADATVPVLPEEPTPDRAFPEEE